MTSVRRALLACLGCLAGAAGCDVLFGFERGVLVDPDPELAVDAASGDGALADAATSADATIADPCGRSCLGGACVAGMCTKVALGGDPAHETSLADLYGLVTAADADVVYATNWYQPTSLLGIPKDGGPSVPLVRGTGPRGNSASPLRTRDGVLFYALFNGDHPESQGLYRVETSGLGNTLIAPGGSIVSGIDGAAQFVDYLAVDDSHVFWSRAYSPGIFRAKHDGTEATAFATGTMVADLEADADRVYYVERNIGVFAAGSDLVPMPIATPLAADRIALDETSVFVLVNAQQKVFRVAKSGGPLVDITPGPTKTLPFRASAFVVDSARVYVSLLCEHPCDVGGEPPVGHADGVWAFAKDGSGTFTQLESVAPDYVSSLTYDEAAIYFSTTGRASGAPYATIYKLAK